MKKYLREKKEWVSEEEYDAFHAKKRAQADICRGKKPHDFILMLPPWGVKWDGESPYNAEAYYEAMDKRQAFVEKQNVEMSAVGIILRDFRFRTANDRYYVCSVCKKNKWEPLN